MAAQGRQVRAGDHGQQAGAEHPVGGKMELLS
jgi:hypothetical protein